MLRSSWLRKLLPLAVATTCVACAAGDPAAPEDPALQTQIEAVLDHDVELGPGETAHWTDAGLFVTVIGLVGDSRCPSDATCVWAGDAEVQVRVRTTREGWGATLHTHLEPRELGVGGSTLRLVDVLPHPTLESPPHPRDPRVILRLESGSG